MKIPCNRGRIFSSFSSNIEDNWNKKFSKRFVQVRKRNVFVTINHFHICSAFTRWAGDKGGVFSRIYTPTAPHTTIIKGKFTEKIYIFVLVFTMSRYLDNLDHAAEGEGERDQDDEERDQGEQVGADPRPLLTHWLCQGERTELVGNIYNFFGLGHLIQDNFLKMDFIRLKLRRKVKVALFLLFTECLP